MSDEKKKPESGRDLKPGESPQVAVLGDQVSRIRTTATWLVTTFGALGAALIASLQLAGLGRTEGINLLFALIGFAIAIAGASVIIWKMGWVLASGPKLPADNQLASQAVIEEAERRGAWILGGFSTVEGLADEWTEASRIRQDKYEEFTDLYEQRRAAEGEEQKQLRREENLAYAAHEAAARRAELAMFAVYRLYIFSDLHEIRRRFQEAQKFLVGGVIAAAVGIAVFAVFVSADLEPATSSATPAIASQPVGGTLNLYQSEHEEYAEILGESCDLNSVSVVVLGASPEAYDLVTVGSSACETRRLTVPLTAGTVLSAEVELPAAEDSQNNADSDGAETTDSSEGDQGSPDATVPPGGSEGDEATTNETIRPPTGNG